MLSLDPAKLLLIGVVALVVLGPDKLPAAARKLSSLHADFQKLRTSLNTEVQKAVEGIPLADELRGAHRTLQGAAGSLDPRQALYRAVGLTGDPGVAAAGDGPHLDPAVPGSIDLAAIPVEAPAPDDARRGTPVTAGLDPTQN